jgi:hypothetical protein
VSARLDITQSVEIQESGKVDVIAGNGSVFVFIGLFVGFTVGQQRWLTRWFA